MLLKAWGRGCAWLGFWFSRELGRLPREETGDPGGGGQGSHACL